MIPLFLLLQAAPAAPTPWTAVSKTDAASGKTAVSARALSKDGQAMMSVRCDTAVEPVVSIQVRSRTPLATGPDQQVLVRFDAGQPVTSNWQFPGGAMLTSSPQIVTALTTQLVKAHLVEIVAGEGPLSVTYAWDGPGSADGIAAVLTACGYELGKVPTPVEKKK